MGIRTRAFQAKDWVGTVPTTSSASAHSRSKARKIRILVADDHTIFREGLKKLLSLEGDLEVVAEAENGQQTLELVDKLHPDVVLLDLRMPGLSGIGALHKMQDKLKTTRVMIVDEIHAVASSKRGSHLALSLERLSALCCGKVQRIGLSATQKPIEKVARFLIGAGADRKQPLIVDSGHFRPRDLQLEVPPSPLEAVMSAEVWD